MGIKELLINTITAQPVDANDAFQRTIGRPHIYLGSADPSSFAPGGVGRAFARHMLPTAPMVGIRPGRISFTENLVDVLEKSGLSDSAVKDALNGAGEAFDLQRRFGVTDDDRKRMDLAIAEKQRGTVKDFGESKPLRYFEFEPAIADYLSVYATLSSRMFSRMIGSSKGMDGWSNFAEMSNAADRGGFFTFWSSNSTSVSESASAEVEASMLAGAIKAVSDASRQAQFFIGSDPSNKRGDGMVEKALAGVAEAVGGGNVNGMRASLGSAILGMNPMFPDVWKDSSFGRSYNLSFKFHSPYGHPAAIYKNVLAPFMMLMSLVLPVSRGPSMYTAPFVFQLDCPGYFACDLGICTAFDFVKGGSENLWTDAGLPRAIDVTMQVRDLYPVLTSSHNMTSMYVNTAMGTFLDNLAAVNLSVAETNGDVIQRLRARMFSGLQQGAGAFNRTRLATQRFNERTGIAGIARTTANLFGGSSGGTGSFTFDAGR